MRRLFSGDSGRSRSLRDERGQGLVEFALILPVFLLVLVGILEFGSIYSNVISVRQGIREAGRQGSVAKVINTTDCPAPATATPDTNRDQLICYAKHQAGVQSGLHVWIKVGPPSYAVGNSIVICAVYDLKSLTGFIQPILNGRSSKTESAFRVEGVYPAGINPGGDGVSSDYNWCTT